jgi:hypothetical protein
MKLNAQLIDISRKEDIKLKDVIVLLDKNIYLLYKTIFPFRLKRRYSDALLLSASTTW